MTTPANCRLLFGPYRPPALQRGDRTVCWARDCDIIITGWSDGRISWPRCRALGTHGSGSGVLVDDVLAWTVRHEAAIAIRHWWGVGTDTVAWWRRALGVDWTDPEGSRRLIQANAEANAAVLQRKGLTEAACDRTSERARNLNLIRFAQASPAVPPWTADELAQLGTVPDDVLARQTGG